MKKEAGIILFFSVLAMVFYMLTNFWDCIVAYIPVDKEFVLIILLVLIQSQILNSLKNAFLDSSPVLIKAKRKLLLFYTETTDSFPAIFKNVTKIRTYKTVGFLLAHLGIRRMDDKNYVAGKKWIFKKEQIPYNQMPLKVNMRAKRLIRNEISDFHVTSAQFEDIFYNCLGGNLLSGEKNQSIIEVILVWVSYFYLLTEAFSIKPEEHTPVIVAFLVITIADMSKHYIIYKKELGRAIDMIHRFHDQMYRMHHMLQDQECMFVDVEGERIPFAAMSDLSQENL